MDCSTDSSRDSSTDSSRDRSSTGEATGTRWASAALGVLQTLAVTAAFAATGPLLHALEAPAAGRGAPYPAGTVDGLWLVDGFNVIQVAALAGRDREAREGWWREPARRDLLERAGRLEEPGAEVWVVFDGPHPALRHAPDGRARGVFAPSADRWVLERLREAPHPGRVRVVTADRSLAERARRRGARVVTPGEFLARCGASPPRRGPGPPQSA